MPVTEIYVCSLGLGEGSIVKKAQLNICMTLSTPLNITAVLSLRAWISSAERPWNYRVLWSWGKLFTYSHWLQAIRGQLMAHRLPKRLHLLPEHPCQPFQRTYQNRMACGPCFFPLLFALNSFQSSLLCSYLLQAENELWRHMAFSCRTESC